MKNYQCKENMDIINSFHYESIQKIKNLFSNIILKQNENSILKKQLFSYQGFYPEIFFTKLDYLSKKNIMTIDILYYLEQHHFKFNDEIIRRLIKQYDKHGNLNLIYEDFVNILIPWDENFDKNKIKNNLTNCNIGLSTIDEFDTLFCEILVNELKLIGLIGDLIIDIRKFYEFDCYKIFEIISNKEKYLNGEMLFKFLEGKYNIMEINRLVYYLDSNNDGLISYDDFNDLLLPIKGDFENIENNDEFLFNNEYEKKMNLTFDNNIYNPYNYNKISQKENLNHLKGIYTNHRKTYFINYKINTRNKAANIKICKRKIININKNKNKIGSDSISLKYLNNSVPIHEQNEISEKEISRDEKQENENSEKNNDEKEEKEDILKSPSEKNNLNINQNSDKENKEENSQDIIQNITDDKKENVTKNNLNVEYKSDENLNECLNKGENKDSSQNKENININLNKFPNTFGKNQDNDYSSKKEIKDSINDNCQAINNYCSKINPKNSEKQIFDESLLNKNIKKSKNNSNIRKYLINNENGQNKTYVLQSKLNLGTNDYQYNDNDIILPNTYNFPLIDDKNINNNINIEKYPNIIDTMSLFFEYINLIIYYENRIEHIKESLALREDLSTKEIFYLFDKDKTKYITINNFQLICKKVFKIFPTLDQIKLLFKRYKKDLNLNSKNNEDCSLSKNEFIQMITPKKSEYISITSKKNKIDKTKSKLSTKSKNILIEMIKCLIIKESNYYKIRCQLGQNNLEYIWTEIYKYIDYGDSIGKKELNEFLEEYGYFLGEKQIEIIFSIFDKDKKGFIIDNDFFEEMCSE